MIVEIRDGQVANNGQSKREHILTCLKNKIYSKPCKNQGYILDGLALTPEEVKAVFSMEESSEEGSGLDLEAMPEFIVTLEATDYFLRKRVMALSESKTGQNSEEAFLRRLTEFRGANTDDNTILNFFDEQEIHTYSVNAEEDESSIVAHLMEHIGNPRNYGPSKEELRKQQQLLEEQKVLLLLLN
jgi:adenylate kinase